MRATSFISSRLARSLAMFAGGLVVFYVLSYSVLSFCGSYRPMIFISAGVEEYSYWAPVGFYDAEHTPSGSIATKRNGTWRRSFMTLAFLPLWSLDNSYVHKVKYLGYIHETRDDGRRITPTNNVSDK
jgi:hypothetical protein